MISVYSYALSFVRDTSRLSSAACLLLLMACSMTTTASGELYLPTRVDNGTGGVVQGPVVTGVLRVLTLNVAHGRKDGFNQLFLSKETIRRNLDDIAALLRNSRADIVALQEADGPSLWSGGFDHVALLAKEAGYPWYARAPHARSWLFEYGTALLSKIPFVEVLRHDFQLTPPSPTKGLLLGQIVWRPSENSEFSESVDIISTHFDFSRGSVRRRQLAELVNYLAGRTNPVVILGDFNSDWSGDDSVVAQLARQCNLHVYRSTAKELGTYRSNKHRFDWVLLSSELGFVDYNVVPDIVSDHSAVVADIRLKEPDNALVDRKDKAARCMK